MHTSYGYGYAYFAGKFNHYLYGRKLYGRSPMVEAHPDLNRDIWVICDNNINTWCLLDDLVGSWILFYEVQIVPTVNEVQIVPGDT
jgi:hypothetical protein